MPTIQAFRGLRYDFGHVGSLSEVVAPPYDVIDPELQDHLYNLHPNNVIRLILNRAEAEGEPDDARYERAGGLLKQWRQDGVLSKEFQPALYVYHQVFSFGGVEYTRRGFMCRTRLERFGEGTIYPHEQTHAGAKADRLKLTKACQANLSQIFGIYPDPEAEVQNLLEATIVETAGLEATDHLGVIHRLWPVTDVNVITAISAAMAGRSTYVADGHHRYETACNYRDELAAEAGGELDHEHPANFVLMMCVGMHDQGMIVLPTHRLFRELPVLSSSELIERLGDCFDTAVAGEGPEAATALWEDIETEDDQSVIGIYCPRDNSWVRIQLTDAGAARLKEIAPEQSEEWRGLGVSILHKLVVETLLDTPTYPKPKYVHQVEEVVECLAGGDPDADGAPFPMAALVMPATLDNVRQISENGERMPAKSTYFYPKLLSGLVINPLE